MEPGHRRSDALKPVSPPSRVIGFNPIGADRCQNLARGELIELAASYTHGTGESSRADEVDRAERLPGTQGQWPG